MRYRFLVLAASLMSTAQIGLPQGGMSATCDNTTCRATFMFEHDAPGPVTNAIAAYSGRQTMESVETHDDGTRVSRPVPMSITTWRDSQGRIRTERPLFGELAKPPVNFIQTEIQDPVAGYIYVLDVTHEVAHRVAVRFPPMRAVPAAVPGGAGSEVTDLGTKVMFGAELAGRRVTIPVPGSAPGVSESGSDRPTPTIIETWTDPKTNVVVLRKTTSPTGDSTVTIQDYTNAEPNPALFQIPRGWQTVDEENAFTITLPKTD